jgi:hypothetical protein
MIIKLKRKQKEKKKISPVQSSTFFKTHISDQQKESEKMLNNIYLNIMVSRVPKKKVLKY